MCVTHQMNYKNFKCNNIARIGRYYLALGGTGSVRGSIGRYLVVLGQCRPFLVGTWQFWVSIRRYWLVFVGIVYCWKICRYLLGDLQISVGTVLLLEDLQIFVGRFVDFCWYSFIVGRFVDFCWHCYIVGRFVDFCWYFLLLEDLQIFVGRFNCHIYFTIIASPLVMFLPCLCCSPT